MNLENVSDSAGARAALILILYYGRVVLGTALMSLFRIRTIIKEALFCNPQRKSREIGLIRSEIYK